MHQTRPMIGAEHVTVTTHSSFTKFGMISIAVLKVGVFFFVEPEVKSQRTVLVGYLNILLNVSCYQTRCRRQYYLSFSNTAHACTSAWCAQHSSTAAAQNSQLDGHSILRYL